MGLTSIGDIAVLYEKIKQLEKDLVATEESLQRQICELQEIFFEGDILNELVPLFPAPYFHIGGDVHLAEGVGPAEAVTRFLEQRLPMLILSDVGNVAEARERLEHGADLERAGHGDALRSTSASPLFHRCRRSIHAHRLRLRRCGAAWRAP